MHIYIKVLYTHTYVKVGKK
uniref:Uncharacterized protein n=1 Tax=Anguilla anguilla TaxID=7936 RepID=A0A0E9Q7J5_ANGAN